ncbi:GNAT family N-acetyltransferase [Rhizobium sp. TRM95111]|uniref:GNAT family N-acetyltransferase n=1 Tax=Rhizobium alarense TaxID=2846851 RepID=UPI001F26BEF5|nr:GNAT family N-acetyltransferase [Rhizobium alarense]MCF3642707.1 GNAT family N-acetyltransferase [Rhizobium alarense]
MSHPLDNPIWTALGSTHAHLSQGGARARRYPGSIVPFAATIDDEEESLAALEALVRPGETVIFLQRRDARLPASLTVVARAAGVQMVAAGALPAVPEGDLEPLCDADAAEMLALAELTKPGPFTLRAQALGRFWGVRREGRLVAMAGERLMPAGFSEVSGLCTHPDWRGRGFGRQLFLHAAHQAVARHETPFLHAYATNETAIALYRSLGFAHRCDMHVAVLAKAG